MEIRDRVRDLRRVRARDLVPNPSNWRTHPVEQQAALKEVLESIGFAGALLARETDDRRLILVDGHLRADTAPDMQLPVLVLDISEAEADVLLATYDPIGAMADAESDALASLLGRVDVGSDALRSEL